MDAHTWERQGGREGKYNLVLITRKNMKFNSIIELGGRQDKAVKKGNQILDLLIDISLIDTSDT